MYKNQKLSFAAITLATLTACAHITTKEAIEQDKHESVQIIESTPIEQATEQTINKTPKPLSDIKLEDQLEETAVAIEPKRVLDLWEYIRSKQQLTSIQHPRVEQFEQYFLKHSNYLKKKTDKAAPYLYYIIQELEKRQMPLELAFTPMVESNFDPLAHSVVQAAGLWQFMPKTARGFGIEINDWYDGRRDVVASTEAALDYYQYLNKLFNGDWLLTVAAYNYGQGNVLKAIKKNKKKGKATDYWSLDLPKETQRHIPKWIALSNLLINQSAFNLQLTPIENAPRFESFEIAAPVNLVKLASETNLNKEAFYRLNPAFNRLFIPAEHKKADLLIPVESRVTFEEKLSQLPADTFNVSFSYKVKAGDNLSMIAKKHKTRVSDIKKINHLKSDRIKIGQSLKLPGAVTVSKEENEFFTKLGNYKKRRRYQVYKVRSGDSLWKIAKKFKVTTRKLARWNGLSTKKILRIGQPLKIWPSP